MILKRVDPWVLPLISWHLSVPLPPDEVLSRLRTLIAPSGTPPSEERPFRGEVSKEALLLDVRVPTSGLAKGLNHERALALVRGTLEATDKGGTELKFSLRQPLPAFVMLFVVWAGFIYTILGGASPALLMTPISGHVMLVLFFQFTARQRVMTPLSRVLETKL